MTKLFQNKKVDVFWDLTYANELARMPTCFIAVLLQLRGPCNKKVCNKTKVCFIAVLLYFYSNCNTAPACIISTQPGNSQSSYFFLVNFVKVFIRFVCTSFFKRNRCNLFVKPTKKPAKVDYFMTYFRRLCFTTVSGVL